MRKEKGMTYTYGYLLALIIGLIIVTAVGLHLILNQHKIGYNVISVHNIYVVKRIDGYYIKLLITNQANVPVKIDKIVVTDGTKTVAFGDNGEIDHFSPSKYLDTLASQNVVIKPGRTIILQEFQEVPSDFQLNTNVTITIYYTILSTHQTNSLTLGGEALVSNELINENGTIPPPPS